MIAFLCNVYAIYATFKKGLVLSEEEAPIRVPENACIFGEEEQ